MDFGNKIFYVGIGRAIDGLSTTLKSKIIGLSDINEAPIGAKVLSLHTADTIEQILSDSAIASEKGINFIGCNQDIGGIFIDKGKTKEFLSQLGFSVSKGVSVNGCLDEIKNSIKLNNLKFPILVKEVDNTGGQGIYVLLTFDDIKKLELDSSKQYVIEEFIEGEEYSCMAFVYNGSVMIFPPIFKGNTKIDNYGRIVHASEKLRSNLISIEIDRIIREIVLRVGGVNGVNGFIDFDFIFDKNDNNIKILEINPRVSGITDISFTGTDFKIDDLISMLLGNEEFNSNNLLRKRIIIDYPILFDKSDFIPIDLNIKGAKVLRIVTLRKFPPYMQKSLIEFESVESYNEFIDSRKS